MEDSRGFTLIELMIVGLIVFALAAVAVPRAVAMKDSAKEGAIRSNMHQFQLAAEDYAVQNGWYADYAGHVHDLLPAGGKNFKNPLTQSTLQNWAWIDLASPSLGHNPLVPGSISYADTFQLGYVIKGLGEDGQPLSLVLSGGIMASGAR